MSKKVNLVLGSYAHLPSGASEAEFELLYRREICPLVQALRNFPKITMVFYYSGVILNWIERRHPELFMLIDDIRANKQVEFLGGGFFNPMFPFIAGKDTIGQIEMFNTYLGTHFGKRPQGCWVSEMAWDQRLILPLNSSKMHYTFLSERYFTAAGAKPNEAGLYSPCITEDQGKILTVFPIATELSDKLRNAIAESFSPSSGEEHTASGVASIMKEALDKLPDGDHTVVIFPFTMDTTLSPLLHERFFLEISESASSDSDFSINFVMPANLYKHIQGRKKLYFPNVWACPHSEPPLSLRQILVRHVGSAAIYSKIMYVHPLVYQLRGDKIRKRIALEELWKAQDSGVFCSGGTSSSLLLKTPVRNAAYRSLLEAEKITRGKGKFAPSLSVLDFDLNGEGEYVFQDTKLNCYVKQQGAAIFALDYLPASWNYADMLLPCTEDTEQRMAFVDWFAPSGTKVEDVDDTVIPNGRFCGNEKYQVLETDRARRRQSFKLPSNPALPFGELELEKTWQLKKNVLSLEYLVRNTSSDSTSFMFCPQLDLAFPGNSETALRLFAQRELPKELAPKEAAAKEAEALSPVEKTPFVFDDSVIIRNAVTLEFQDILNEALVTLEGNRSFDAKIIHIRSKARGQEEYLSTCIMPFFQVSLEAGKTWKMTFSFKITP